MAKRGRKPSLSKLEEQRKAIDDRIKAAKKEERQAAAELETQRFAIIGAAIARELAENEELSKQLEPLINKRVTKAADRRFLGLDPLPKKSAASGAS